MENEDIYEPFHVSEWDLQNEFNPNRSRKVTKKQQIYGIWASSESEDEEDRKSKKGKASKGPINFVSGGFKDKETEKSDDEEEEDDKRNVAGPSNVNKRGHTQQSMSDMAGLRYQNLLNAKNSDFGKWEAYTKGVGGKLLLRMGYKPGKGLGKNLQGRIDPIEAKKREGKGAIGLYGSEGKEDVKVDEKSKKKIKQPKSEGSSSKTKTKTKYVYKLAEDLEDRIDNLGASSELSRTKVIDMTGPEQRVLSGYHEIHKRPAKRSDDEGSSESDQEQKAMDEFKQDVIRRTKREIKLENQRLNNLLEEKESLQGSITVEKRKLNRIEHIVDTITLMNDRFTHNELSPEEVIEFCEKLCKDYKDEFPELGLSDFVFAFLFPLLELKLQNWDSISNPSLCYDVFEKSKYVIAKIDETIYDHLIWEVWMPLVRRSLTSWPTYRQCDEVISFLEKWKPLMPEWLLGNMLEQIIIPLLEKEVQEWNPLTDTIPVHSWIHPWLPLMDGYSLENVYATIRYKLGSALTNWHPSDCSAKLILQPWQKVFPVPVWNNFLQQNIVPKLDFVMQSYEVNPQAQRLDVWEWVTAWENMIPTVTLASILEKNFMPKWLRVLYDWLTNNPNFDEVSRWYMGWKSMFSEPLLTSPVIKDCFNKALEMMNYAVTSPIEMRNIPFTPFMPAPRISSEAHQFNLHPSHQASTLPPSAYMDTKITFKQILEKKAEEKGILFMPVANRYHEAKQVYKFGSATICLDQQMIFMYNNGQWQPVPLHVLVDSASANSF